MTLHTRQAVTRFSGVFLPWCIRGWTKSTVMISEFSNCAMPSRPAVLAAVKVALEDLAAFFRGQGIGEERCAQEFSKRHTLIMAPSGREEESGSWAVASLPAIRDEAIEKGVSRKDR